MDRPLDYISPRYVKPERFVDAARQFPQLFDVAPENDNLTREEMQRDNLRRFYRANPEFRKARHVTVGRRSVRRGARSPRPSILPALVALVWIVCIAYCVAIWTGVAS